MFDFLIVGAGFAGSVLAERLASQLGKSCLIVERRNHIGGNAYDRYDDAGVLVHNYGPHYFAQTPSESSTISISSPSGVKFTIRFYRGRMVDSGNSPST